jgi:ParB-like chromosome segregation protein Spo0J
MAKTTGRKAKNGTGAERVPDGAAAPEVVVPEINGIKVFCAHREIVPVESVVPNPRNPNTHPSRQIELLARIIKSQGWRAPVTVSSRSGFIVRGHGRYLAALALGMKAIPVDQQDYESEAAEWADLIADNRIAELAEMDMAKLKEDLATLDDGSFDMSLTGFDSEALEDLLAGPFTPPPSGNAGPPLEPPPLSGPDTRAGRFLLVFLTDEERKKWADLLGVPVDTSQVVYTVADCPALAGAKEDEER